MSEIIQLYKDSNKTIKVYPKAIASEVYLDEENNIINKFDEINSSLDNKANEVDLIVERNRIDNLTKLEEGSTTGDAELIDGRVGSDGFTYNNIGEAIRGQIKDIYALTGSVEKIETNEKRIIQEQGNGRVMTGNNGDTITFSTSINWQHGYVNVNFGDVYEITTKYSSTYSGAYVVFTDDLNKQLGTDFINDLSEEKVITGTVTIPRNCTRLYVTGFYNSNNYPIYVSVILKSRFSSLQEQIASTKKDISGFSEEIELIQKSIQETNQNYIMQSRLGYDVYNSNTPPQQSIESYKLAYKNGFRVMLFDLRITSDGEFVCSHDDNIKDVGAKNNDGSEIVDDVLISNSTLEQLNMYDFGIYKGEQYKGTKILTVKDIIRWCKLTGCIAHCECKVALNDEQILKLVDIVETFGMENNFMFHRGAYTNELALISEKLPNCWVGMSKSALSDVAIEQFNAVTNSKQKRFMVTDTVSFCNEERAKALAEHNIIICYTEIKSLEEAEAFYNANAFDYVGMFSTRINTNEFLFNKLINS